VTSASHGRAVARGAACLVVLLMLTACAIAAEGFEATPSPTAPARIVAPPSASATATTEARLPVADAPGEDLDRLPRYPGSIRTAYEISRDAVLRSIVSVYLAEGSVDEVRAYYQGVIVEHGWERADIDVDGGEWTYVLINGSAEAMIHLRAVDGLVEIALSLSEPHAPPAPLPPAPEMVPEPTPEPTDDDDDDDDDD
jgi:hypothetical protein